MVPAFYHKFFKSHSGCENSSIFLRINFHRISDTFMLLSILLTIYNYLKSINILLIFLFNKINSVTYCNSIFSNKFQLQTKLWTVYKQIINLVFKCYHLRMSFCIAVNFHVVFNAFLMDLHLNKEFSSLIYQTEKIVC